MLARQVERIARKVMFGLSSLGLLGGLILYVASFAGVQLQTETFMLAVLLHAGMFLTYAPLAIKEREVIRERMLYAIYPDHVRNNIKGAVYVLFAFFIIQFVLLLALTRGRSINAENGEFLLGGQGGMPKVISKAEYDRLKGYELRLFASGWVLGYFITATYWWFPRQRYLILPIPEEAHKEQ